MFVKLAHTIQVMQSTVHAHEFMYVAHLNRPFAGSGAALRRDTAQKS